MNPTIVAIATAHGVGSIAIVRLSGADAYAIGLKLSQRPSLTPRYATLTPLYALDDTLIDEALVIYFKNPKSFTGEDVVEFQCHGGMIVADSVLRACVDAGARLAEPGEFSKRAFLNGRLDLTQAEAIASLIEARSDDAARILARQMKGELRGYIESIRDSLLEILAYSEVVIDYAEEDLPLDVVEQIFGKLEKIKQELSRTLESSVRRSGLMQGYRVAIIGKPNVGKSSLLNALLDYERAIVSDIAGTTRDTIEEQVRIGTHLIRLVDTAGIRDAHDEIERIGIERSIEAIENADVVIALFDSSRVIDEEDRSIIELIERYREKKSFISILNKSDLAQSFDTATIEHYNPIRLSCKQDTQALVDTLSTLMDRDNDSQEMMLISQRQITATRETVRAIDEAYEPLHDGELEFFSFHINAAIRSLSSLTRPYELDEMFDKMFGQFCLGK
ncbi:MAG: tRNA uridine-5-carboxymethylaminomethyl(34) synthesis GTPase MnmE [Sulfuricurvum sp.]|uniref:tRNA uridine-5-carboxymethylaminomethyl(34) synthesis GTPase MnmE n=1 Tax=Sulfuricurvum sp. TaxID=2025608 RepID=UPI00261AE835|nr:tRNA uridine-5-carboxymethylaminomethyl(34) synthesis GTPase MnmE [Sulfuricurvum sp.]MDD2828526.1 tRNA uridine-5-carboxymethylaminomethyl(34) synthesis GTPase MnmE [Sulfuricurvum sp.]MDD4948943.1 tRNA uridine-5-carboxymethylaminomethyl(34) synthesis GTPase MnmE [Sulfuricurvum sp.]